MAKALARPPARRSRPPERERELKRLCLSVCDDTGFRLYAATYDQPRRRDQLIARLGGKARAGKVRVTRLDIAKAGSESSLVGLLRAHLGGADLPPGWRQAVMVVGIEQRLDYSSGREGVAFLHQANLLRDALPEAAPVPVVLWLSPLASAAMQTEAPDLWDWRAASFDFTGDQAPRIKLLRELTTLRPQDETGLTGKQRRARIRMLDDLLAELERQGSPKSKRQAAERANLLLELGIEESRLGRAAEAIPRFDRVLKISRDIGDQWNESSALGGLGRAYWDLGETSLAIKYAEQQLTIAREIGDRWGESNALGGLSACYSRLGEMQRVIDYRKLQLSIAREIHDLSSESNALLNLGRAYLKLGELSTAMEHFQNSLKIAEECGNRRSKSHALGNLGNVYADLGELQRAIRYFDQELAIAREIGDRRGESAALFNSALTLHELGELAEAIRRMGEAFRFYDESGPKQYAEHAQDQLARWHADSIDTGSRDSSLAPADHA